MSDQYGNSDDDLDRGDYLLEQQRDREMMADIDALAKYQRAVRALNEAAYAVIRAGKDTTALPDIDRRSLRLICSETDRLVEDGAKSGMFPSKIEASS